MVDPNLEKVFEKDAQRKRDKKARHRVIAFAEYLELVREDPLIAQNSPSRLLEIVLCEGAVEIPEAERWLGVDRRYKLFANSLFGVEKMTATVVDFLRAGASRLSTGKQILLLVGPTASGKSTFVNILKKALEKYGRLVYAIRDCPMFEEPLHLLPRYLREQAMLRPEECPEFPDCLNREESPHIHLGVRIEGDLCPVCRHTLEDQEGHYKKSDGPVEWWRVPVETFTFSIQGTRGIGSFEPSDEKSSDVTELVGRENIAITSTKGYNHPLAYTLCGELEKANRGICEGRELIKADEKLLWVFISVAEEKEVKVQGSTFPHISVDEVVIGHTNLTEYKRFAVDQGNEALHDRIYVVPCPYPLRVADEVKIYEKLISQESDFGRLSKCHIAPGSLKLAAIFAILTRLNDSQSGVDRLTKLKLYNGDMALTEIRDKDRRPLDLRSLLEESQSSPDISKREGMFGVSSRDVLAALNAAMVEQSEHDGCLTPLKVIRALRGVFDHRMGYTPEEIDRFLAMLSSSEKSGVMTEYRDYVVRAVSKAYLRTYIDLARQIFVRYMDEIDFHKSRHGKFARGQVIEVERDTITGKPKEPDMKFIRSVEEHIPVSEQEAENFRAEILMLRGSMISRGRVFNYDAYPPLAKAVEAKLLHDSRDSLALVLSQDRPRGEEERRRVNDLFDALKECDYCEVCAREMVEKAREFLSE